MKASVVKQPTLHRSLDLNVLEEYLQKRKGVVKIQYDSAEEARKRISTLRNFIKTKDRRKEIVLKLRGDTIYALIEK